MTEEQASQLLQYVHDIGQQVYGFAYGPDLANKYMGLNDLTFYLLLSQCGVLLCLGAIVFFLAALFGRLR